jgi:hypothetical protein
MGFVNGLFVSPLITPAAEVTVGKLKDCIAGRTNTQMAEIMRKYINDSPERWNVQLNLLGLEAIAKSCPSN